MYNKLKLLKILQFFPGGPVVKTLSTNAGGAGLILGWGAEILHALWPKNQKHKTNDTVKNSKQTLKVVHIKRSLKKYIKILQLSEFGKNVYTCETNTTTKIHCISVIKSFPISVQSILPTPVLRKITNLLSISISL